MAAPITGYVGPNGGGKTLGMVEDLAVPALNRGVPVLANFVLNHPLAQLLESWVQLVEASECVVLLDEITSVMPSRESMRLPAQLAIVSNQLRKRQVQLGWTAPAWARADTMLREVTQEVCVCRGYFPDKWQRQPGRWAFPHRGPIVRDSEGRRQRVDGSWLANTLFRHSWYDAQGMDEFTYGRAEKVPPKRTRWYWRPAHEAQSLYGTLDPVELLDHLDEAGLCVHCGGIRRRRQCKCREEMGTGEVRRMLRGRSETCGS